MGVDHKFSETIVDDEVMGIWDRPDHKHTLGEMNGEPSTWWLWHPRKRQWMAWIDKGAKRPCFRVEVTEQNYTKYKWDDWDVRYGVTCSIYINNVRYYTFVCGDIDYALARAQVLKVELVEHPSFSNIVNVETHLKGRKIWYKNQPAVIERFVEGGEVWIAPDGIDKFNMKEAWMTEDHELEWAEEWEEQGVVVDALLSKNIQWYRE
jgi:hypothetical protein